MPSSMPSIGRIIDGLQKLPDEPEPGRIVELLPRHRLVITAALLGTTVLAWVYLLRLNRGMGVQMDMQGMLLPMTGDWRAVDFLLTLVMWSVMMVGMMVPSVAPTVLTFALVHRQRAAQGKPYLPAGIFLMGYLAAWAGFSLLATTAEWRLHGAALLDPVTETVGPRVAAGLLGLAGLFQLTPAKKACLRHCRSPVHFLAHEWREGRGGAFRMGVKHGLFCVGCCWMLMGLLFVAGVMNLLWVAAIAAFVMAEKLLPGGRWITFVGAAAFLVASVALFFHGVPVR